ncbi:MAG: hypothetical protein WD042_13885 [Phycisphaeraceae bacterium]
MIEQIKLWLWNVYQAIPGAFDRDRRDTVLKLYGRFMEPFRSMGDRLAVLTTNYDVLFEYIATHCDRPMPVCYPFDARALWVNRQNDSYLSSSGQRSLICKLHGSVNYFEANGPPPDNANHPLDTNANTSTWFGVNTERAYENDKPEEWGGYIIACDRAPYPATVALGTLWRLQHLDRYRNHGRPIPAMIPPTYAKLHETPWLRQTWSAAMNALTHAHLLIAIGYSMPPSDGFMRAMIQGALARRMADPALSHRPLAVFVLDRSDGVLARYRDLFHPLAEQGRLITRRHRFEEWDTNDDKQFQSLLAEATK